MSKFNSTDIGGVKLVSSALSEATTKYSQISQTSAVFL